MANQTQGSAFSYEPHRQSLESLVSDEKDETGGGQAMRGRDAWPQGRHVVQIAAAANTVFALCADGSVWKHNARPDPRPEWGTGEVVGDWTQLPTIPDRS